MNLSSTFLPARLARGSDAQTQAAGGDIDLDYISHLAAAPGESPASEVEAYHRALFLGRHAPEIERSVQESRIHGERVEHLEARLGEVKQTVSSVNRLLRRDPSGADSTADTWVPWTLWDRVMVAVAGLGVLGLLVFGVLNISFNLLESGLVTFQENPVRAYFWAELLPVGAMAVKIGWDSLDGLTARKWYLWSCLGLGVVAVLLWVGAYAAVYPSLSKNTAEQIGLLSVFDSTAGRGSGLGSVNGVGTRWVDVVIVSAQAIAELFISAALGIYMTRVFARHTAPRLPANPLFRQLEEERAELEADLARARLALGSARGLQQGLEHQLAAVVALARATFQKEAALRSDRSRQERQLLDQIAGQLRSQLQTVGAAGGRMSPDSFPSANSTSTSTPTRIGTGHE